MKYVVENPGPDLHSRITDLDGVGDGTSHEIFDATFFLKHPTPSHALKVRLIADRRAHSACQKTRTTSLRSEWRPSGCCSEPILPTLMIHWHFGSSTLPVVLDREACENRDESTPRG